ncbi:MAG TPA: peptidoglycan DD-metalloendopeptidase family protein [Candidatus Andersenbacteria bacterium]|nr:MAG: hypothetical protein A2854_05160 [Parcubacteria group bacterium RIFCSPHIGHO2_01_FULL_56_18]HLD26037.1 peptidoglycan DD-metalloendopeptidase family protein [Candidatus Andersenbacteria bacterium]
MSYLRWWSGGVVAAVLAVSWLPAGQLALAQTVDELRHDLESTKDTLRSAEERIRKFKEDIQIKKQEARSLQDQISVIEENISGLSLVIEQTSAEIANTEAEIEAVQKDIEVTEVEIARQKTILAEYIRSLYAFDQQSSVALFLKYATFSAAITEAATYEEMQTRGQEVLQEVKRLRQEMREKQTALEGFRTGLTQLQQRQEAQQATLASAKQSKERVLDLTKEQESEFQRLLAEAQRTHQSAEAEIGRLDAMIREELRKQGIGNLPSVGVLSWPVQPIFGVSCEFHCAGYPYAYLIGPHAGMDIPTNVGTPILAPADGYVARVRDSGGPGYSYILLLHGNKVSTVFGHVSGFAVGEGQMVSRGSVIGYSGGAPGTHGAGLSSGPHLHFEVRVDNAPVNPRQYL